MSIDNAQASSDSNVSANKRELLMEPLGYDLSTSQAFRLMADVMDMLRVGVDNPQAIRLEMAAQELRIKSNTDVLLVARKPNGNDAWNVMAEHQIRRVINPEYVRFSY